MAGQENYEKACIILSLCLNLGTVIRKDQNKNVTGFKVECSVEETAFEMNLERWM